MENIVGRALIPTPESYYTNQRVYSSITFLDPASIFLTNTIEGFWDDFNTKISKRNRENEFVGKWIKPYFN
ncbi:hypothetical protein HZS_1391 [Henneguya salminicola]|nr:hypothetical protein HZS_1391 [Henneguya salminicola]